LAVPNSSTYYVAGLFNLGTWSGTAAAGVRSNLVGFGNATTPTAPGTTASSTGLFIGFAQDGSAASNTSGGNLVIRYNSGAGLMADSIVADGTVSTLQNTGTNLVIAEISVGSGIDTVTWWLNPTDGSSDSALTSSASASGSFTGNIVNDANPGSSFARLNWISQGWGNSSGASTFFDEPRLSTDLAGLGLVAVPEPTAAAVLGLVGLMGLGRRRRA
jgi:hypothetical protein